MIKDIKMILKNKSDWVVQHIYRECNKVAQNLVRYSLNVNDERVWIESVPEEMFSFVNKDKLCTS